jgi:large subunit ribosomal protein L22
MAIRKKKPEAAEKAETAEMTSPPKTAAKKVAAKKVAAKKVAARKVETRRVANRSEPVADAVAIQRGARQSPYKMRLVMDQIRGKNVNEALGLLRFSKKHAAVQIAKTLNSAVANAEHAARQNNESLDVDTLYIKHAIVNEGPKIKRFMPAAQGRATPIQKRTSHVHIVVGAKEGK